MAVTITRSVWIDDDGTGQTGTVINQALHTTLYNEIDTALAKVAQLAGGNTFTGAQTITGNQTITGLVTVNGGPALINLAASAGPAKLQVQANQNAGEWGVAVKTQVDVVGGVFVAFLNAAAAAQGAITAATATSVTYGTTSDRRLKTDAGRARDLSSLQAVVVHDFTWNVDGRRDRGVFAQEAHTLYPRAVVPGTDETAADGVTLTHPWMTDYSKFVPDLIVGWQQHDAALVTLRAMLAELKGFPDAE